MNKTHKSSVLLNTKNIKPHVKLFNNSNVARDKKYKITNKFIGGGSVKKVYKGKKDSEELAISVFKLKSKKYYRYVKYKVPTEIIEYWQKCNKIGRGIGEIIDFLEIEKDNNTIQYLIQPHYNGPNLQDFLGNEKYNQLRTHKNIIRIVRDIFDGFITLHNNSLIHGDPKCDNIQLHFTNDTIKAFIVDIDLTHLNCSSDLDQTRYYQVKKETMGAPIAWAPEIIMVNNMDKIDRLKAETWSVGIIISHLIFTKFSYNDKISNIYEDIYKVCEYRNQDINNIDNISSTFKEKYLVSGYDYFEELLDWDNVEIIRGFEYLLPIVKQLLIPNPAKRPFLTDVKNEFIEAIIRILYLTQWGSDEDYLSYIKIIKEESEKGDSYAQCALGLMYQEGLGVEINHSLSREWYKKSAKQENAIAENSLGSIYQEGMGVDVNQIEACKWFKKSAKRGNIEAKLYLGQNYLEGLGVEKDIHQGFKLIEEAAKKGDFMAQYNLSELYLSGIGTTKNDEQALFWHIKAAEYGHSIMQYNLGLMYANGTNYKQDFKQALYWFNESAETGFSDSQYSLGQIYEKGLGVEKDYEKAFEWYTKAADGENSDAYNSLGQMYEKGLGVDIDYTKAVECYKKAADMEHIDAQANLTRINRLK